MDEGLKITIANLETGSAVIYHEEMKACIWVGKATLALMLNKDEIKGFQSIIDII